MLTRKPTGDVPNILDPHVDVISAAGPGRTILAITVDHWLIDEFATLVADLEDQAVSSAFPGRD